MRPRDVARRQVEGARAVQVIDQGGACAVGLRVPALPPHGSARARRWKSLATL
jgi:hypothetical protein